MKKLFSLLLALAMLLGCTAFAEAADFVGVWTLETIESGKMSLPAATLGMTFTIDLVADGTANLDAMGEKDVGTWIAIAGGINLTDSSGTNMDMLLVDGKLVMAQDGIMMVFDREGDASAPAVLTAATLLGHWALTSASVDGLTLPTATLGMAMEFTLAAEGGSYAHDVKGEKLAMPITYTVTEGEDGLTLALQVAGSDGKSADILVLKANAEGNLVVVAKNGAQLIFEKQPAAETAE